MKEKRRQHVRRGFTMVELMAVLIILGLLAGVVVRSFVSQVGQGEGDQYEGQSQAFAQCDQ